MKPLDWRSRLRRSALWGGLGLVSCVLGLLVLVASVGLLVVPKRFLDWLEEDPLTTPARPDRRCRRGRHQWSPWAQRGPVAGVWATTTPPTSEWLERTCQRVGCRAVQPHPLP